MAGPHAVAGGDGTFQPRPSPGGSRRAELDGRAMTETFYVTTPIYYVNGAPHIGHAYTSIAADVVARWKRLDGRDVFFLTGTDAYGQKVEKAAQDAGLEPQAFTDRVSADFRDMAAQMGISYDDYIRTTEPRHHVACKALWLKLVESG